MTNAEQLDLEKVKQYDDSWWLRYLKENTVFDTEQIKAHKDWLIERVQELERGNKQLLETIGGLVKAVEVYSEKPVDVAMKELIDFVVEME